MNVIFISHCTFTGNSAMHIFSIANHLSGLGVDSVVCVPHEPETVHAHGTPRFLVMRHEEARTGRIVFADGRGPDLIHAWTPRELIRTLTETLARRFGCPYVVHLEDNEEVILKDDLQAASYEDFYRMPLALLDSLVPSHRAHPVRYKRFLEGAAGVSVLMDRLREFAPPDLPSVVFWPGFEPEFARIDGPCEAFRARAGVQPGQRVIVYTGNVHASNAAEVRSLYLACAALRRKGVPVRLLKTGWNYADLGIGKEITAEFVTDLGFLPRHEMPSLLSLAELLVQPGKADEFNEYRFPSKLPEFFASGRPVMLPRSNIGRFVSDGVEALVLTRGDAGEIAARAATLLADPELQVRIGRAGREFALRELDWRSNVAKLRRFYEEVLSQPRQAARAIGVAAPAEAVQPESPLPAKLIAFYLPQFHPIPENDEWWGKGFTEWRNVVRAQPNFEGHYQPHLPADLGFYDLRVPEVLEEQARLARIYGIYGFCFYYYWFNGRRVLERPLETMLRRGKPDIPFCVCWANENWTRRWDGSDHEVLLGQEYSPDGDERFLRDLLPVLRAPNYIRINDAPLLLVYRVNLLPDARRTADAWREIARREGFPGLHLCAVQSFAIGDPRTYGFDAAAEFPPHLERALIEQSTYPGMDPDFEGYVEDYVALARRQLAAPLPDYVRYRGVMPSWDNTPRRGRRAHIVVRSSPSAYETWLAAIVEQSLRRAAVQQPLVFINAWNEWAEGTHLEPDQKFGHAYLQATRQGLTTGIRRCYASRRVMVSDLMVSQWIAAAAGHIPAPAPVKPSGSGGARQHKTSAWFTDAELEEIARRYTTFGVEPVSVATVRDYCDSVDHLRPIATHNGDLKDCQRPWVLKAILGQVRRGGRVLEIGAGEPFVADLLARLGYEVWVVDPYDGTGNGPLEYERFRRECPEVHFVRDFFSDRLDLELPDASLDCIYSISVLEHVPPDALRGVLAGMRRFLSPSGWNIHAVDHVHQGRGAAEHLDHLRAMTDGFGLPLDRLDSLLAGLRDDPEVYYLSAESHNRWRGAIPYEEFPMRVCVSVQLCGTAAQLHSRAEEEDRR